MSELWFAEQTTIKEAVAMEMACRDRNEPEGRLQFLSTYTTYNNRAMIKVEGPLRKGFTWYGTSYDNIKAQIEQAEADSSIKEISLIFNSGGGQVIGVAEVASAIQACKKPTIAYASFCCSAAYYIASQCNTIIAEENAMIGSIGTVMVIEDWSKVYENAGVKVNVISSGKLKGMGYIGTELSEEQLQEIQTHVDKMTVNFKNAVMTGRGLKQEEIDQLATGGCWIGADALKMGLVDKIDNQLYSTSANSQKGFIMEQVEIDKAIAEAKDAGIAEGKAQGKTEALSSLEVLMKEFADNPTFAIEQFKAGASLIEAKAAYSDVLAKELEKVNAEKKEIEAKKANAVNDEVTEPVKQGTASTGSKTFMEYVEEIKAEKKCKNTDAIKLAMKEHPEAYAAFRG